MAQRLLEIIVPRSEKNKLTEMLVEHKASWLGMTNISETNIMAKVILQAEETESLTDALEKKFSILKDFHVFLLPVEATIPRKPEPPKEENAPNSKQKTAHINREELYGDIADGTKLTKVFILMIILSSIVAAIGLINSNIAAIIGAMVIAPLLISNVALSLGVTLGDTVLIKKSLKMNLAGLSVSLLSAVIIGFMFSINLESREIAARTVIGPGDIALALASGCAATLAFTTGASRTLIGVMVAAALLPPLVTFGLLIGSGYWKSACGALWLVLVNLICINLAGVLTFVFQGITPLSWYEKNKAKRYTIRAIIFWGLLLLALIVIFWFVKAKSWL